MNCSAPASTTIAPVAIGTARASDGCSIVRIANATPTTNAANPNAVQTEKYARPASAVSRPRCAVWTTASRYRHNIGTSDGSIIAIIITIHMPRNETAAPGHVCPGMRIHAIDIVHPPGMGIPPMAAIDAHQAIVNDAVAAKSSADTP